jgi:putative nucleotidyltransferase with HDIG domain
MPAPESADVINQKRMTATSATQAAESPEIGWKPQSLPPFPGIAIKALRLMAGTDTSLLELCNLIRGDPAFSAEILKIANSPLVAFSKNVTSVMQASMLLGFQKLRSLVITIGLKSYMRNLYTPLMKACWSHSVATALIAERGAKSGLLDAEFAYTAGVLHDIGRIALAMAKPNAYAALIERGAENPTDSLDREHELCGIDHCQAGASLVDAWSIPPAFAEIALHHHSTAAPLKATAALVPPSCALAESLGFRVIPYKTTQQYAEIVARFPENARKRFPEQPQDFAVQIASEIKLLETP